LGDYRKSAAPPLVGYGVTKSLLALREQLGQHDLLFGHTIRLSINVFIMELQGMGRGCVL
jgi:hypothetical protein